MVGDTAKDIEQIWRIRWAFLQLGWDDFLHELLYACFVALKSNPDEKCLVSGVVYQSAEKGAYSTSSLNLLAGKM